MPPLTIYFNKVMTGVTRRTLSISFDGPLPAQTKAGDWVDAGVYLPIILKMYGEIVEITGALTTPHTAEPSPYAISFLPSKQFFVDAKTGQTAWPAVLVLILAYLNKVAKIDLPRCLVELHGDFVYAPGVGGAYSEFAVLDADNIGGQVGEPPPAARQPPIQGGKNPSGDLTQGGFFESWFFLGYGDAAPSDALTHAMRDAAPFDSFGATALKMPAIPPLADFSSAPQIAETSGVSAELAQRIVAARAETPFAGAADFRKRLQISDEDWAKLDNTLVIL